MENEKNKNSVAIIIPAYNEAVSLPDVISDIRKNCSEASIVVVDDGSTDNTSGVARDLGAIVLRLPVNIGYGAALQTGFKYALKKGFDYVVIMDGDGQHLASEIDKVLGPVRRGEYDLVIGSRYIEKDSYEGSFLRKFGSMLFAKIASFFLGFKITDPTSGFQAMNRKILKYFVTPVYPPDYPDADVLIASKRSGFKIREVAVKMLSNSFGESMHSGLKPLYYIFKMCFSIFLTFLRKRSME
ncbi:MAG: glycosyltransferase family 2 protein [Candidatus Schekmanbacteria bacterium]|nr:MAG: glycosyltransferase family 2 protein [Candidatus Schekmanbacteria bacterium]